MTRLPKRPLGEGFGNRFHPDLHTESVRPATTPLRKDSTRPAKTEIEKTEYQKLQEWLKKQQDAVSTLLAYNQLVVDLEQRLSSSSLSDTEKQQLKETIENRWVKNVFGFSPLVEQDMKQFVESISGKASDSLELTLSVANQNTEESKRARISFLVSKGYTQAQAEKYQDRLRSAALGVTSVLGQSSFNRGVFKK